MKNQYDKKIQKALLRKANKGEYIYTNVSFIKQWDKDRLTDTECKYFRKAMVNKDVELSVKTIKPLIELLINNARKVVPRGFDDDEQTIFIIKKLVRNLKAIRYDLNHKQIPIDLQEYIRDRITWVIESVTEGLGRLNSND